MKVLLFYGEDDKALADALGPLLSGKGAALGLYAFKAGWNAAQALPAEGAGGLSGATHLAALASKSPAKTPWFGFASGFALGAGIPLILCGEGFSPGDPAGLRDEREFAAWIDRESKEWAGREGRLRARRILLEKGIPVNEESFQNCVGGKNREAAALFLEAGFSPDSRDRAGVPLLALAVRSGDRDMAALLLAAGADLNLRSGDRGGSALLDAALGKQHGIMADLLAAGADPDIKSKDGQPALTISVGLNDEIASAMLLEAGAGADERDSLGTSPRQYAVLFHNKALISLFDAHPPRETR